MCDQLKIEGLTPWSAEAQRLFNADSLRGYEEAQYLAWYDWASFDTGIGYRWEAWNKIKDLPEEQLRGIFLLCREACYQVAP